MQTNEEGGVLCYFCGCKFQENLVGRDRNSKVSLFLCQDCGKYSLHKHFDCPQCSAKFRRNSVNCCTTRLSFVTRTAIIQMSVKPIKLPRVSGTIQKSWKTKKKSKNISESINQFNTRRISGPSYLTEHSSSSSSNPVLPV